MIVFDIEGNGLNADKIWCMSKDDGSGVKTTTHYKLMRKMVESADILIGHNIIRWDIPTLERILDIKIKAKLVDTLALSWYLYPNKVIHGLAAWGEEFGVPKPPIDDWDNLTVAEYKNRCAEDVKINKKLWDKMWKHLLALYESEEEAWRLIDYLSFKMHVARLQEETKWKLDTGRCLRLQESFSEAILEKTEGLAKVMPKVPSMATKRRPVKYYKKNGDLRVDAEKWIEFCKEQGVDPDKTQEIEYVKSWEEPNPGSHVQMKKWLYDLGWKPITFKYKRNKDTGDVKKIPQINLPHGGGICASIKELYSKEPQLDLLDGLSVLTHRISVVKGFLANVDDNGYVEAQVQGLTNTLRWKHKVCVNLPGIDKPYGADLRGCLIAPRGYKLCGSDMSALEDITKQHYFWPHDPEYVKTMMAKGYCPHIDIAELAGYLTHEQGQRYRDDKFSDEEDKKYIVAQRKAAKPVNYGGIYGQGAEGLNRETGMGISAATKLTNIYRSRNWAVNAVSDEQITKTCRGQKWLYNPVSKLWYSLRHNKDIFSTLNQGTGVYCFDTWVKYQLEQELVQVAQFHDETINLIEEGSEKETEKKLRWAIDQTNKELSLNRELDIDVQFGDNYSEIH